MNVTVSARQRGVAAAVESAFEVASASIREFWDDDHRSSVCILEAAECPRAGAKAFSTVGLSDSPLIFKGTEYKARVEFVGVCGKEFKSFDNVLASLAFCVINSKWFAAPGIIFPDVLSMYGASRTLTDIYFAPPFLWDDRLKARTIEGELVAWLLAVPISKSEADFAARQGPVALEDRLEASGVDIFDLGRSSAV